MRRGTALHHAAETLLRHKKETGKELPQEELSEIAVANLEDNIDDGVQDIDEDPTLSESKKIVQGLASGWSTYVAPTIGAIEGVEEYLTAKIEFDDGIFEVEGYLDLIDVNEETGEIRVRDWKTGKSYSPSTYENSLQLGMYTLLASANGFESDLVRIDHLRALKSGVKHESLELRRGSDHHLQIARIVQRIDQFTREGVFVPNPTSWTCNPGCDYWSSCPFRKPDVKEVE